NLRRAIQQHVSGGTVAVSHGEHRPAVERLGRGRVDVDIAGGRVTFAGGARALIAGVGEDASQLRRGVVEHDRRRGRDAQLATGVLLAVGAGGDLTAAGGTR